MICSNMGSVNATKNVSLPGIYPSSFTNVHFLNKDEFLTVVKHSLGSQVVASSATGSWQSPSGVQRVNPLEH